MSKHQVQFFLDFGCFWMLKSSESSWFFTLLICVTYRIFCLWIYCLLCYSFRLFFSIEIRSLCVLGNHIKRSRCQTHDEYFHLFLNFLPSSLHIFPWYLRLIRFSQFIRFACWIFFSNFIFSTFGDPTERKTRIIVRHDNNM